jgi:hypothetical protein
LIIRFDEVFDFVFGSIVFICMVSKLNGATAFSCVADALELVRRRPPCCTSVSLLRFGCCVGIDKGIIFLT